MGQPGRVPLVVRGHVRRAGQRVAVSLCGPGERGWGVPDPVHPGAHFHRQALLLHGTDPGTVLVGWTRQSVEDGAGF